MNSKLTTNLQLPTTEPQTKQNRNENKPRKQLEQEQNHTNGYHKEGYRRGGEWGKSRGKVQGIRSINGKEDRQGEVKHSMGNGEAKELMYNPWT